MRENDLESREFEMRRWRIGFQRRYCGLRRTVRTSGRLRERKETEEKTEVLRRTFMATRAKQSKGFERGSIDYLPRLPHALQVTTTLVVPSLYPFQLVSLQN
ncbi:hypothetical protein L2E82_06741 [Cichorium intybus]|uniref:Uncharacterized protein n=1 Tax=Cichorium intybus TaxID=13427 RepID=A0ACB9HC48_CICIN|nr:hypothetical protein L2E82_06741 [Cichorium intybus]